MFCSPLFSVAYFELKLSENSNDNFSVVSVILRSHDYVSMAFSFSCLLSKLFYFRSDHCLRTQRALLLFILISLSFCFWENAA